MDFVGQAWSFLVEHLDYLATFVTLACVILGVKRSLWQFPVGIVGTALFFIVVWRSQIYANAALQVFFVGVQFYGWWYWLKGSQGHRPPIRTTPLQIWLGASAAAVIIALVVIAPILRAYTPTTTPLVDANTFTLSVVAQFLLDRKRLESWYVWIAVNVLSIWLYYQAQLWPFLALYIFFFFNAFWGWWEWRNAMRREAQPAAAAA